MVLHYNFTIHFFSVRQLLVESSVFIEHKKKIILGIDM